MHRHGMVMTTGRSAQSHYVDYGPSFGNGYTQDHVNGYRTPAGAGLGGTYPSGHLDPRVNPSMVASGLDGRAP